jgi:hypothetical protein
MFYVILILSFSKLNLVQIYYLEDLVFVKKIVI